LPLSPKIGRHFLSIPTELHTAPIASMVFGRVVKKKNARGVFALLDQGEIRHAQQVARKDCERRQERVLAIGRGNEHLLEGV
jgi:hypothetical protein